MHDAATENGIQKKYLSLEPVMNERVRRQWAATEATALGRGGIATVARATGLARNTIVAGIRELEDVQGVRPADQVRGSGGGRKKITEVDPDPLSALEALVDPVTQATGLYENSATSSSSRILFSYSFSTTNASLC